MSLAALRSVGIPADEAAVVPIGELESTWIRYLERLKVEANEPERWRSDQGPAVMERLERTAELIGDKKVLWLPLVSSEPVGIEVRADQMLRSAGAYFVTRANDLMLSTPEAADGLCLELNHLAEGNQYELTIWGTFTNLTPD